MRRHTIATMVEGKFRAHLPAGAPVLVLPGDACRADLRVEFD